MRLFKVDIRSPLLLALMLWGVLAVSVVWATSSPVRSYLMENRLDEAIPICRQFDVLSTKDADNYVACAWVYYRTGRIDSAENLLDKLKGIISLEVKMLNAYSLMKRDRYVEARQILSELEKQADTKSVKLDIQELQAEQYELQGQLDTAAFIYKLIVGDDLQRPRSHWGLARHYLGKDEKRRAVKHLKETARLWPSHFESRYQLGVTYLKKGDLRRAGKWLAESYRLNRADARLLETLGVLFEKKGQYTDAVKYWQRAVDLDKDRTYATEQLASYYDQLIAEAIEIKKHDQALKYIGLSETLKIERPLLLRQRGIIYRNLSRYEKAAGDLKAYLVTKPDDVLAIMELGICYVNLDLKGEAEKIFRLAVSQEPENGQYYAWWAYALENNGKPEKAMMAWKKAVRRLEDPKDLKRAKRKLASIKARLKKKRAKEEEH